MSAAVKLVEQQSDMDRKKALEAALSQIDRAFGKGSVMKLGANQKVAEIEAVSTGSLGLDIALGIEAGGLGLLALAQVHQHLDLAGRGIGSDVDALDLALER